MSSKSNNANKKTPGRYKSDHDDDCPSFQKISKKQMSPQKLMPPLAVAMSISKIRDQ
jgi:hypothetical protein